MQVNHPRIKVRGHRAPTGEQTPVTLLGVRLSVNGGAMSWSPRSSYSILEKRSVGDGNAAGLMAACRSTNLVSPASEQRPP
jgi:hypothetical protein